MFNFTRKANFIVPNRLPAFRLSFSGLFPSCSLFFRFGYSYLLIVWIRYWPILCFSSVSFLFTSCPMHVVLWVLHYVLLDAYCASVNYPALCVCLPCMLHSLQLSIARTANLSHVHQLAFRAQWRDRVEQRRDNAVVSACSRYSLL